jgi:hypothetical protein
MSARTPAGAAAMAMAAALLLTACRSGESARHIAADSAAPAASQPGDTPAGAPNVVTVTATDFRFEAPAEIPAGLTTFKLVNSGPSLHHVQLIKLEEGKTADDFLAALKAGGPPPRWASVAGGPNPPEPGGTSSTTLAVEPGNYAMLCFIPAADGVPHMMKGMVRPLTVTGPARAGAAEPTADLVMKLVDFDFQLSQPLKAGRQTLRVENAGGQPHEVAIVRLEPGKEPVDFAKWGERPSGPAPGKLFGGVSGIMPGTHAFVEVDLPPGDYGLLCFVPNEKDGKPHFMQGMAKRVKVS